MIARPATATPASLTRTTATAGRPAPTLSAATLTSSPGASSWRRWPPRPRRSRPEGADDVEGIGLGAAGEGERVARASACALAPGTPRLFDAATTCSSCRSPRAARGWQRTCRRQPPMLIAGIALGRAGDREAGNLLGGERDREAEHHEHGRDARAPRAPSRATGARRRSARRRGPSRRRSSRRARTARPSASSSSRCRRRRARRPSAAPRGDPGASGAGASPGCGSGAGRRPSACVSW